jgi:hypothetical protein
MMVFGEGSLYRHLQNFINYYHRSWTHLALAKDRSNWLSSAPWCCGSWEVSCIWPDGSPQGG